MIEIAIFDVAGTTVQEHGTVYQVLAEAVRSEGADPSPEQIATWMGADKRTAITALLAGRGDVERTFAEFRRRLAARYREQPPQPMPGAAELFAALRAAGIRLALSTGFDREVTGLVLDAVGWTDGVLDTVVCTEDVAAGRPAPYLIFRALERTGCADVRRALVAGDTPRDVAAGLNAGAGTVVAVRSGGVADAALMLDPRVVILDGVAQVADLLGLGAPAS